MNREFFTPLSQHVSGEVNNHRGLSLTLKGPLISHPSTMVPTYPSTISRSYPSEIRCAVTNVNFTGQAGRAGQAESPEAQSLCLEFSMASERSSDSAC
jgi:hypothetical protein